MYIRGLAVAQPGRLSAWSVHVIRLATSGEKVLTKGEYNNKVYSTSKKGGGRKNLF